MTRESSSRSTLPTGKRSIYILLAQLLKSISLFRPSSGILLSIQRRIEKSVLMMIALLIIYWSALLRSTSPKEGTLRSWCDRPKYMVIRLIVSDTAFFSFTYTCMMFSLIILLQIVFLTGSSTQVISVDSTSMKLELVWFKSSLTGSFPVFMETACLRTQDSYCALSWKKFSSDLRVLNMFSIMSLWVLNSLGWSLNKGLTSSQQISCTAIQQVLDSHMCLFFTPYLYCNSKIRFQALQRIWWLTWIQVLAMLGLSLWGQSRQFRWISPLSYLQMSYVTMLFIVRYLSPEIIISMRLLSIFCGVSAVQMRCIVLTQISVWQLIGSYWSNQVMLQKMIATRQCLMGSFLMVQNAYSVNTPHSLLLNKKHSLLLLLLSTISAIILSTCTPSKLFSPTHSKESFVRVRSLKPSELTTVVLKLGLANWLNEVTVERMGVFWQVTVFQRNEGSLTRQPFLTSLKLTTMPFVVTTPNSSSFSFPMKMLLILTSSLKPSMKFFTLPFMSDSLIVYEQSILLSLITYTFTSRKRQKAGLSSSASSRFIVFATQDFCLVSQNRMYILLREYSTFSMVRLGWEKVEGRYLRQKGMKD